MDTIQQDTKKAPYDFEERTALIAENFVAFCKKASKDVVFLPIVSQLVRSGTSIGANYCEANGASSKKDFRNKIYICKKEVKETMYWLRILENAVNEHNGNTQKLKQEAKELTLIFSKIAANTK